MGGGTSPTPSILHPLCLQFLYPTNFLVRECFSVIPSPGLNLHLDKAEFQTALKWWLGVDMFGGSRCPSCSTQLLDPLGHHALNCKFKGYVVSRHNQLRNTFLKSCKQAGVGGQMEAWDMMNYAPGQLMF